MPLGMLRHRVTLKPRVETSDGQGSFIPSYPSGQWIEVWGAVQPLSGPERAMYRQIESDVKTKIIIRVHPSLQRDWIVAYRGQDYDIESVIDPAFRGKIMTLLVKERR